MDVCQCQSANVESTGSPQPYRSFAPRRGPTTFNMVQHVSDSEGTESEDKLVNGPATPNKTDDGRETSQPLSTLSHRFRDSPVKPAPERSSVASDSSIAVVVDGPARPQDYAPYRGDTTVDTVLKEFAGRAGKTMYQIEFENGKKQNVSFGAACSF